MSDIYIPGIRSRFNTNQVIDDLMALERLPRDRAQTNLDNLRVQRSYWQEIGRRINSLRDSARFLFSFQNPFNERIANSANSSVITATATREASEQTLNFTVKQTAQADRFLSQPLDERTRIDAGTYIFTVGNEEIPITFRGGTLREFVDIINSRGRDRVAASLISVQSGTRSLLIESRVTGAQNRLQFSGDTVELAKSIGMMEQIIDPNHRNIAISESNVRRGSLGSNAANVSVSNGVLQVAPQSTASLPINMNISSDSPLVLRLETQTRVDNSEFVAPQPPPGPDVTAGSMTYSGITIRNEPSNAPFPEFIPPTPPPRNDDMGVLHLVFTDGSRARLPLITDSNSFTVRQYPLAEIAGNRTIATLNIENSNTHRDVYINKIEILDPNTMDHGLRPLNAVSTARDAIITMEGIEITRSTNNIDDLIPGVTINVRGASDRPVELNVKADVESVKDAVISFVGNYNRLMAELNVLTRRDNRVIEELTYLTNDEAAAMRERLGVFSTDNTLNTLRNNLLRAVTAPYPTYLERDLIFLSQIGISTNASGYSGYDPSRLRGYLEINERMLDAALDTKTPAIKELFGSDTTGDLLIDTGVAFNVDTLLRPFVELGGIVSLKTSTIDSRINQDELRITNLDRQLAAREQELRQQFARMEAAYARMEQMSNSLNNFNIQTQNNR